MVMSQDSVQSISEAPNVREQPGPMHLTAAPLAYAEAKRPRFVAALEDFIRFPTVSAQPRHADDLQRCAVWIARHLRQIGLEHVKVISTRRHPIVYADWQHAPGRPTVLIYGHYDVQPPDPLHDGTRHRSSR